jgi:23S rRNA G2445 N2-methylase RlmL
VSDTIPKSAQHLLRLVGVYGTNKILAGELSRLVRRARNDVRVPVPERLGPGSVAYPFDRRMAEVAVRYHRTSARVLWQVMSSQANRLEPLYADLVAAMKHQPQTWFWHGAKISVRAFGVNEFEAGERQVVGVVKNAIIDAAKQRGLSLFVDPERPDVWIDVRLLEGNVLVSVDLAGRPMHQRGYRRVAGDAPLREDLAAVMLMLARYDARTDVLLDPMAGSGTICIEAAAMASGRGVWCSGRSPSCANFPEFAVQWPHATPALFADTRPAILCNDIDAEAISLAQANADTAGVLAQMTFQVGDFRQLSPHRVEQLLAGQEYKSGLILSNPPYGQRMGDADKLVADYRDLGRWCRQFKGFRAAFIVDHPEFEHAMGMTPTLRKPLHNGPIKSVFYLYDIR